MVVLCPSGWIACLFFRTRTLTFLVSAIKASKGLFLCFGEGFFGRISNFHNEKERMKDKQKTSPKDIGVWYILTTKKDSNPKKQDHDQNYKKA